jgi:hypothetical protein
VADEGSMPSNPLFAGPACRELLRAVATTGDIRSLLNVNLAGLVPATVAEGLKPTPAVDATVGSGVLSEADWSAFRGLLVRRVESVLNVARRVVEVRVDGGGGDAALSLPIGGLAPTDALVAPQNAVADVRAAVSYGGVRSAFEVADAIGAREFAEDCEILVNELSCWPMPMLTLQRLCEILVDPLRFHCRLKELAAALQSSPPSGGGGLSASPQPVGTAAAAIAVSGSGVSSSPAAAAALGTDNAAAQRGISPAPNIIDPLANDTVALGLSTNSEAGPAGATSPEAQAANRTSSDAAMSLGLGPLVAILRPEMLCDALRRCILVAPTSDLFV